MQSETWAAYKDMRAHLAMENNKQQTYNFPDFCTTSTWLLMTDNVTSVNCVNCLEHKLFLCSNLCVCSVFSSFALLWFRALQVTAPFTIASSIHWCQLSILGLETLSNVFGVSSVVFRISLWCICVFLVSSSLSVLFVIYLFPCCVHLFLWIRLHLPDFVHFLKFFYILSFVCTT